MASPDGSGITLVGSAAWTFRSFRNLWMLEELGVPYTHLPCRPRSSEAFAANPFGKIPALRDGDFAMYESAAINTYLGDKHAAQAGVPSLVPQPGSRERGRYEQLCASTMAELDAALTIHDKHSHGPARIAAAVDAAEARFEAGAATLAAELQSTGGECLLESGFSAADILFVATLDWAEHPDYQWCTWGAGMDGDTQEKVNLREYLQRCRGRPAYRAAKQKGGWLSKL
jgi:glutathione S-transferase